MYNNLKMTLVLKDGINKENIYFLESKKNIIIDGTFTKLLYMDDCVTINGIFITIPIIYNKDDKQKNIVMFNVNNVTNIEWIQKISKLEYDILQYYNHKSSITKKMNLGLANQLTYGKIKLYSNNMDIIDSPSLFIILKISGVWETNSEFGITYKYLHSNAKI